MLFGNTHQTPPIWVKKYVKIYVRLFKNWKCESKLAYHTGPDILVFSFWKLLKSFFNSHNTNSIFLSFELWKLNSKTKSNNVLWVGLTIFEVWVIKIELYNSKLLKPNRLSIIHGNHKFCMMDYKNWVISLNFWTIKTSSSGQIFFFFFFTVHFHCKIF